MLYISLGSHVILPGDRLQTLMSEAINRGLIDGVVWSVREAARKKLNNDYVLYDAEGQPFKAAHILDGKHEKWTVMNWVPNELSLITITLESI